MTNPRIGVRECFIARPGYVFAFADYDGLELRTVAQVCMSLLKTSKLAEELNSGIDSHCKLAAKIMGGGVTYEQARAWHDAGEDCIYKPRQTAKAGNFGFPGGCGIARMMAEAKVKYGIDLSEAETRELKENWITSYPEFRLYFDMIDSLVKRGDPIESLFSGRLRGGCTFTDGANGLFQGLGADATKAAGFALTKECRIGKGPLSKGHPAVYVHDEFWAEVRIDVAHDAALDLARIMCEAAGRYMPDVPPKTKPGLARRMSKKAKAVYDCCYGTDRVKTCKHENGRLVPWDG